MKQSEFSSIDPDQSELVLETKDHFLTGEEFEIRLDPRSAILYTWPRPAEKELSRYYESDAYISHDDNKSGFMAVLYRWVRKYALKKKTALLASLQPAKGALLDIGCGTGAFLEAALRDGWDVCGVEPVERAADLAREKGLQVQPGLDSMEAPSSYDAITLWHVLEHLSDLDKAIRKIVGFLRPGGILLVAVPNYRSYDARYYGAHWAAWDVPRHLWHFSKESLPPLFAPDLQLIEARPMIFDAYYVSLLSEKYKSDKGFSVHALLVGLLSNLKARRTGEYSSLAYIFRKPKNAK